MLTKPSGDPSSAADAIPRAAPGALASLRPGWRHMPVAGAAVRRRRDAVLATLLAALLLGGCATAPPAGSVVPAGSPAEPSGAAGATPPSTAPGTRASPAQASLPPTGPAPASPAAGTPAATPLPEVPATELAARLRRARTERRIPGVSVAIRWADGRTWTGTSGWADVTARVPVTAETGFSIASMSKTFTAAVVLQLVAEGRLTLDQVVAPSLRELELDPRVTVEMLLDHTSGLPDYFLNPTIDAALRAEPDATWDAARALSYATAGRKTPGSSWRYANTNYLLLGLLVERATGRPLWEEIRARLLDPLDLAATWYQVEEPPVGPLSRGYRLVRTAAGDLSARAVGPASDILPFRSVVTASGGAGSMASTASDVARWMEALVAGDVLGEGVRLGVLVHAARTQALGASTPYGLGLQVVTLADHVTIGHSGRFTGFRGLARTLPSAGITIAVLTNQSTVDPVLVAEDLLAVVLPIGSCDVCPSPTPHVGSPAPGRQGSPAPDPSPR